MTEGTPANLRSESHSERVNAVAITTVALEGDLDLPMVEAFRAAASPERFGDADAVILDLTAVRFIDSSGIHALFTTWNALRSSGKRSAIVTPRDSNVERVLAMTGLLDEVAPAPDRAAAAAAVSRED
jgi:anti-anti-sigma factor